MKEISKVSRNRFEDLNRTYERLQALVWIDFWFIYVDTIILWWIKQQELSDCYEILDMASHKSPKQAPLHPLGDNDFSSANIDSSILDNFLTEKSLKPSEQSDQLTSISLEMILEFAVNPGSVDNLRIELPIQHHCCCQGWKSTGKPLQ